MQRSGLKQHNTVIGLLQQLQQQHHHQQQQQQPKNFTL